MIATTTSRKLFAILVISFLSPCIYANDFSLNQFFSLYAGQVLEGYTYAGYDEQLSTKTDNIYGIQATNSFNDSLSISGQLIISGEEDYDPKISWAYLTYEVNPFWKIRAGKLKTSFFMFSDIIDVGYTYPWIRPPIQTYSYIRYKSFDGIDSLYQHTFGDWNGLVQVYAGRINDSISFSYGSVDRSVDEMAGISWSLTYDYTLTLRAVIHTSQFSTTAPNQAVTNLLQGLEAQGYNDLSNSLKIEDERLNYYGLGAHIDTNSWIFISEYTIFDLKNQSFISDEQSFYATLGYKLNDLLFHFTYDYKKETPDTSIFESIRDIAPTNSQYPLKVGTIQSVGPENTNTDYTLGFKYNFASNSTYKLEVTRFTSHSKQLPYLSSQSELETHKGILVSTGIDLVF